jgi:hypothetical protein
MENRAWISKIQNSAKQSSKFRCRGDIFLKLFYSGLVRHGREYVAGKEGNPAEEEAT